MSTYIKKKRKEDDIEELNVKSIEILFRKLKENKINREHFCIFFERKNDINLSDYEVDYILYKFQTTDFSYSDFEKVIRDFYRKHLNAKESKFAYNTYANYTIATDAATAPAQGDFEEHTWTEPE